MSTAKRTEVKVRASSPKRGASSGVTADRQAIQAPPEPSARGGASVPPGAAEILELVGAHLNEWLAVKGRDGRYLWVNAAFAQACGSVPASVVGRTDQDLFEPETAALFDRRDREAVVIGATLTEDETVRLDGARRRLETSRVPVQGVDGRVVATVTVARDVTAQTRAREAEARRRETAVAALVRSIETVDPHLTGHVARMRDLLVHIAPSLGLSPGDRLRLETAVDLSQIGRLLMPRKLLRSRSAADPASLARAHARHERAADLLHAVEVDPEVITTVAQIGERQDGSGHPHGLVGDAIHPLARVLGALDAYVSLTSPRARRRAFTPEAALLLLRTPTAKFPRHVLDAIEGVVRAMRPSGSTTGRVSAEPADRNAA